MALGRYDLNQNKEVNRTEFQYVVQHVCGENNQGNASAATAAVTPSNQTQLWDSVFVEAACKCQLHSRKNQTDDDDDDDNDDEAQNCCDPTRVEANVLYRPGRYISNYTFTICQYLHEVFLQNDCISVMKEDEEGTVGETNLPTASPMSQIVGNTAPTALPSTWLPTLSVNNNSSRDNDINDNDTDTKLSSGILIVLIALSFMIGTMLLYISKKTILDKLVRPNKDSNEKPVDHDDADATDHFDDTASPTFTDEYSVCCWWPKDHRRRPHESDTIAVAAIARGSVIQQKNRHEPTAHELSSHYDEEESDRPQGNNNNNKSIDHLDSAVTTQTKRRSSGKRKKNDDNVVVLVVPAASPKHDNTVTNQHRNTTGTSTTTTTTTNTDHMDDDPVSSSLPQLSQTHYYRDNDVDAEPYNDLMYAGSNQYFDHANANTTNNYLNMVLLRQQQQIQAIIRESDDDDDDTDVHIGLYTDNLDDASSDTSSGNSTSSSADSSKSPSTLERVHNNNTTENSPQRSALLQRLDENDMGDSDDVDPDSNTASSSSSTSSAGIVSNTSSMVALLSDPLLPQSLCNYNANHSSILSHGDNVIATKRPTTITTTVQTTLDDASRANVTPETYTTTLATTMTPTKAKHVKSYNDQESHNIVSKSLISSSSLTKSVVITPENNETDRDDDAHHEVEDYDDDDDINSLLQEYQQKSLSQESVPNLDGANDGTELDSDYGKGTNGDEDKIGPVTSTFSVATTARSLGAGNTPIGISPSNDDYNVTLQWNANPTATAPTMSTFSSKQKSNDVDSSNVATPHESLAPPASTSAQGSIDDIYASDDATTVVVSNQNNQASLLLFRKIFHSPHRQADRRRINDTTTTTTTATATHPNGGLQQGTTTRSRPPIQTVITKNKTVTTPQR